MDAAVLDMVGSGMNKNDAPQLNFQGFAEGQVTDARSWDETGPLAIMDEEPRPVIQCSSRLIAG